MGDENEILADILAQRGYSTGGTFKSHSPTWREDHAEPIREFQKFYALPETGQIDETTKAVLCASRCGVPDPQHGLKWFAEKPRWQKRNLTISIENSVPGIPINLIQSLIERAVAPWNDAANGRFSITQRLSGGDMKISFESGQHGDLWPFSDSGRVLAHAFHSQWSDRALAGQIHFDLSENWSFSEQCPPESKDFLSVAIHEIGHALGFSHVGTKKSVMYSNYNSVQRKLFDLDYSSVSYLYSDN